VLNLSAGPDPAPVQARIRLAARPGDRITVECPDHGPMVWLDMAYRCGQCPVTATETDIARLARWLGGENFRK
jgi:hypothetical protein